MPNTMGQDCERQAEAQAASEALAEVSIPDALKDNMTLFLRLVRKVLDEYDPELRETFDRLLADAISASNDDEGNASEAAAAFADSVEVFDSLPVERATILMRAFASYFHLANTSEENYRVASLRTRESVVPTSEDEDPINDITVAWSTSAALSAPTSFWRSSSSAPCSPRTPPRLAARRSRARSAASPSSWSSALAWAVPTSPRTSARCCRRSTRCSAPRRSP